MVEMGGVYVASQLRSTDTLGPAACTDSPTLLCVSESESVANAVAEQLVLHRWARQWRYSMPCYAMMITQMGRAFRAWSVSICAY